MTDHPKNSARSRFKGAIYPQPDKVINPATGRTLLIDAILSADNEKIEYLLEAGASTYKPDIDGKSPLHYAARLGQLATISLLLKQGAAINPRDKTLATPLFEALESPSPLETLEYLLKEGADANIADDNNVVPLHAFARKCRDEKAIRLLTRATENPNRPDTKGMTPLHYACQQNTLAAIQALLEEGLSVLSANNEGNTALHLATTRAEMIIGKYLLTTEAVQLVNAVNINGNTPLHMAINTNQMELVEQMLLAGANPNLPDGNGFTPMLLTAVQWDADDTLMLLLIRNGADVNNKSPAARSTPLVQALNCNNMTLIRLLLDYNADPNAVDRDGLSPLLQAVIRCNDEAIELLLRAGAKMDLKNQNGHTALHIACSYNMPREAVLLLAHKADPNIRDNNGRTPMHAAVNVGYSKFELTRLLLEAGGDPLIKDNDGLTAYDMAYGHNDLDLTGLFKKKLSEKGISYTPKRPPPPASPPWSGGYGGYP